MSNLMSISGSNQPQVIIVLWLKERTQDSNETCAMVLLRAAFFDLRTPYNCLLTAWAWMSSKTALMKSVSKSAFCALAMWSSRRFSQRLS